MPRKNVGPTVGQITNWGQIKSDLNSNFEEIYAALVDLEENQGGGASPKLASPVIQINGITQTEFNSFWDNIPNAEKYLVYRNTANTPVGATLLGEKLPADPDFQHTGLAPDTNYYTFVIAMANGYLNSDPALVLTKTNAVPVVEFDFYATDAGNDANNGTTEALAVKTPSRLATIINAAGAGKKAKFLDSAKYYDKMAVTAANTEIDFNFAEIDGTVLLAKNAGIFTQPNAGTYPNVWKLTAFSVEEYRESIYFERDGKQAHVIVTGDSQPRLADVNTTVDSVNVPGSFDNQFYANGVVDPKIDVYFHSTTDPNTNATVYRIAKRRVGVHVGNGAKIKNLIVGKTSDNDGSGVFGDNVLIQKSIFIGGGKHNVFISSGKMEDCISWDATHKITAGPFIAYKNDTTGFSVHWQRCYVIMPYNRNVPISGFFGHSAGAPKYDNAIIEECAATGDCDDIGGLNTTTPMIFRRNFSFGQGMDQLLTGVTYEHIFWCPSAVNKSQAVGDLPIVRNCVYLFPVSRSTIWQFNGSSGITLDRVTTAGIAAYFGDFYQQVPEPLTLSVNKVCFGAKNSCSIELKATDVYTGNYNIFVGNGQPADQFRNRKAGYSGPDGSEIRTLKVWQEQTGQDLQSVWVKAANQATLFLNDPQTGDLRLNPNAIVTGVVNGVDTDFTGMFPDGTPITQCGAQEHWNPQTRAIVAGPPTKKPVFPNTLAECKAYIANPTSWNFYP